MRYLDYYMRDVDLTSNMIEEIVQRSPVLKKFRDGINAGVSVHSPSPRGGADGGGSDGPPAARKAVGLE